MWPERPVEFPQGTEYSSPVQDGASATAQCGVAVASIFPPATARRMAGYSIILPLPRTSPLSWLVRGYYISSLPLLDPCFTRFFA